MTINSKPNYGVPLVADKKATNIFQLFLDDIERNLNDNLLGSQVTIPSYIVTELPSVTTRPGLIFVSDETGGAVPAFSDGTNWRRVTDRAIVS